jgi:hypothetical protein
VKRASKGKRRSKTIPVLGAAGLSLALASETSLASTAPALDTMTRNAGVSHEFTLREEEACDISLATFHVFDKEGTKAFRAGERPVTLGQACCQFACLGGKPRSKTPIRPRCIRPRYRVRLGRRTGQFGKSDKTLPRPCAYQEFVRVVPAPM